MSIRRSLHLLLAGALSVSGLAAAERAVLKGRVTDETGVAVAGARVELQGAEFSFEAQTGPNGEFRIEAAEGEFTLRASKDGYFVFTQTPLPAHAGENAVEVRLNHLHDLSDSVNVTYAAPEIDPQQTAQSATLTNVEILQIPHPASEDYRRSLPLLPGVVLDNAGVFHVNGGTSEQTSYRLNGFNLADPVTGRLEARLNVEALQTVEMQAGRFSADRGGGSAGALEVRTKMGDDRWRFGATNFVPSIGMQGGVSIDKFSPRLDVSGPIVRGRAWFDNAVDAFYNADTVSGLPAGRNRTSGIQASDLGRAQLNLTATNILVTSFLVNYGDYRRQGLSFLTPFEATVNRWYNLYSATLHDSQYFANGSVLDTGFASTSFGLRVSPQGEMPFRITAFGQSGNFFENLERNSQRQEAQINYQTRRYRLLGGHRLLAGTTFERVSFDQVASRHEYQLLRADQSLARKTFFSGSGRLTRTDVLESAYLIDRWTPAEPLLIEAGVRSDGDRAADRIFLSPRISAAWAPHLLHGVKVAGGYGVFYDALTLDLLTRQDDQVAYSTFFAPNGRPTGQMATAFALGQPRLELPRHRVASVTVERALALGIFGKLSVQRREGSRGLAFANDAGGYALANSRRDRYTAMEISVRKTFAHQFEWAASYTRSSARTSQAGEYSLENPFFGAQAAGPFAWDAPNRALLWGWAPVPVRGLPDVLRRLVGESYVSCLGEYHTGFPFSSVNDQGWLEGAPNGSRFPAYFNVNAALERRFLWRKSLWAWRVAMNNVTANQNANVVNNDVESPRYLTFGRGQARAIAVRLRFLGRR